MGTEPNDIVRTSDANTLKHFLIRHPVITFLLMGCCFLIMGIISLNLIYLFHANFEFILEYGIMGLSDGGLMQLAGLIASGLIALIFYVVFKTCEKVLVEWLSERKMRHHTQSETKSDSSETGG